VAIKLLGKIQLPSRLQVCCLLVENYFLVWLILNTQLQLSSILAAAIIFIQKHIILVFVP